MRRALQAAAALAAIWAVVPAVGAEPQGPGGAADGFDWSGFHIGIFAGAGWRGTEHCDANGSPECRPEYPAYTNQGWLLGASLGYDYQLGNGIVVGIEADYAAAGIAGSSPGGNGYSCNGACYSGIDGIGTMRGRFGYDFDGFLPFVTAGVAFVHFTAGIGEPTITELSRWEASGVLGAGVEYALTDNLSAKADYLHIFNAGRFDYDQVNNCGAAGCFVQSSGTGLVRAGLNLRF